MTQEESLNAMKMGYNVFLTGPPGSGKTFLLNKYIEYLRENNQPVAVTASTGIAATHMNGTTLHSWSGLGIKENLTKTDIKRLIKKPYLRKHYKHTKVLIIDEISMLTATQFDAVDRASQQFKASFQAFGGMQVICSGDLFQLPPLRRGKSIKPPYRKGLKLKTGQPAKFLGETQKRAASLQKQNDRPGHLSSFLPLNRLPILRKDNELRRGGFAPRQPSPGRNQGGTRPLRSAAIPFDGTG